jgi:hypothetical protein
VVCPNCGRGQDADREAERVLGQRVVIDRWPAIRGDWRTRRGAVVALRREDAPSGFAVKRLIGLPGETISIRDGDLWLGPGKLYRKSWSELMAVAIPVHDDRFRAAGGSASPNRVSLSAASGAGWRPLGVDSAWRIVPDGYDWPSTGVPPRNMDWLAFRPAAGSGEIRDFDAYNQALSRHLERMDDLVLRLDAVLDDVATLELQLRPARRPGVRFEISRHGGCRIWTLADTMPRLLKQVPLPLAGDVGACQRIGVAHCDRQAIFVLNDREMVRLEWDSPAAPDPSSPPITVSQSESASLPKAAVAIGARSGRVKLGSLWLARDIHYLPGAEPTSPRSWRLADDEWFVLGDNAAASTDSRQWGLRPVRTADFTGVVRAL